MNHTYQIAGQDADNVLIFPAHSTGEFGMKGSILTVDFVRRALDYDPKTGHFCWKYKVSAKTVVGRRAGSISGNGRRFISLGGETVMAHRLAWFHVHGVWPDANLRQKDGDYDNCSLDNLEEASAQETVAAGKKRSSNKSGYVGVSWQSDKNKWVAVLTRNYRRLHLGYFNTVEEAAAAYAEAVANIPEEGGSQTPTVADITSRRRIRKAWNNICGRFGEKNEWHNLDEFSRDIVEAKNDHTLYPANGVDGIGPGNFIWVKNELSSKKTQDRSYYNENKDLCRSHKLKNNFGITLGDYEDMHSAQDGKCAICHNEETATRLGKVKKLAVDHNHSTGQIRGLLCEACNKAIGHAKENIDTLKSAIAYLEHYAREGNVVPLAAVATGRGDST